MSNFEPVRTFSDLESLNEQEIIEGYWEGRNGEPEPGGNRGRAIWHGWRNGMIDSGRTKADEASASLAREFIAAQKATKQMKS